VSPVPLSASAPTRAALLLLGAAMLACSGVPAAVQEAVSPAPKVAPAAPKAAPVAAAPADVDQAPPVGVGAGAPGCEPALRTPRAHSCAIARASCGDVIEATNANQVGHFDDDFVVAKYCTPQRNGYADGPEAIWALDLPPNTQADIQLASDCADLDLFSIRWPDPNSCPSTGAQTGECEASTRTGIDTIKITTVAREETHLVWADGKGGAVGNFRLEIKCKAYR